MVYNSCDPCISNCGPGAAFLDPQSARVSIGIILCQIKGLLSGGGPAGPVTVMNGPGAAAVNIQDGGNSITIDGVVTATPPAATEIDPIFSDYPFASITGAYTVALANALPARILDVLNDTDADLLISFDGVGDDMLLKSGTGKVYDLYSNGLKLSTSVRVKNNGVAPTLGSLVTTLVR